MVIFIGLLAGAFGSLVGLGGGVVMIPLMVGLLKMEQHKAHGTSLVTLVFTGITGMIVYQQHDSVNLWAAVILAAAALLTVWIGVKHSLSLPSWKLKRLFGYLLCFVAVVIPLKLLLTSVLPNPTVSETIFILLVSGAVTGFLSGMLGVGGGSIMVPAMVLLAGFDQHTAQGTSLLAMIPVGATAAYAHWRLGQVNKIVLPFLIPSIIIGAVIGGVFAHYLPELILRLVFAVVLLWNGIKFIGSTEPETEQNNLK